MRRDVEEWWKQAKRDLITARNCKNSGDFYVCSFFCQQSVEKGLKAFFLLKKRITSGKTHSLIFLALEKDTPAKFYTFLRRLAPEFVTTRYPDAAYGAPYEIYDKEIAAENLEKSREVILWIKSQIEK
jgi:HEPN domain-containing protein